MAAEVTACNREGEPESVRHDREALACTVSEFADPAQQWELSVQCDGAGGLVKAVAQTGQDTN